MVRVFRIVVVLVSFAVVLAACGASRDRVREANRVETSLPTFPALATASASPTATATSQTTASPSSTLTATRVTATPTSVVLVDDDFSHPNGNWDVIEDRYGRREYANNAYRIFVNDPDSAVWSFISTSQSASNVRIEVDAMPQDEAPDTFVGIICRAKNYHLFYALMIADSGYHLIAKYKNHSFETLASGVTEPRKVSLRRNETVRLRVECRQNILAFYVDGNRLLEVQDDELKYGHIGLIVSTQEAGTEVLFDNFIASRP